MPKPKPRPWLVTPSTRKSEAGRPRTGPDGTAVRQLARVTIRGTARTLSQWDALRNRTGLPGHALFKALVNAYVRATMTRAETRALLRDAQRRQRVAYSGRP